MQRELAYSLLEKVSEKIKEQGVYCETDLFLLKQRNLELGKFIKELLDTKWKKERKSNLWESILYGGEYLNQQMVL